MEKIKVQIFRRTVKDRKRGDSYKLLYDFAEGVKAVGDEIEIGDEIGIFDANGVVDSDGNIVNDAFS